MIARSTAFTYKGKAVDVRQVGRDLGVRYVLEGSEQHGDNRVRVTAQLINAQTGGHVWADKLDVDRTDLLDMLDEIVTRLARALDVEMPVIEAARIARTRQRRKPVEDRVSGAIRNPKSLRRSIGLQSMVAIPTMNRSAKDGARSSPHYGGEGVTHLPIEPRCLLTRFMRDPGDLSVSRPTTGWVSNPLSGSEVGSDAQAGVGDRNST